MTKKDKKQQNNEKKSKPPPQKSAKLTKVQLNRDLDKEKKKDTR